MPPEDTGKQKEKKVSNILKLLLKLGITVLCFWYISKKIDFANILELLAGINPFFLFIALLFFIFSKLVSAYRLNIYFSNIGLQLSQPKNLRLYWLGMFYNLFLPGAISGDAYKVILLHRRYGIPYKKLSAAVFVDRFSGVVALGVILCIYGIIVLDHTNWHWVMAGGSVLGLAGYYFGIRLLFPLFLKSFMATLLLGVVVQAAQVVAIYFILSSLGISLNPAWIFVFLASAIITILPVTLGGGLGTREVVFAEGARYFNLDPQTGVAISLLFYFLTVVGSLWGLVYNFRDPLNKN